MDIQLKLTQKINGKGNKLYVVTSRDLFDYFGLWYATGETDLTSQLVIERNRNKEYINNEYNFYKIGEV